MIIGLIGMALLILAWIPEIMETLKKGGKGIEPHFAVMITLGDLFLLIYSYQIGDPIFISLNGILLVMALVELYFTVKKRKILR